MAPLTENIAHSGQLGPRHSHNPMALGLEMNGEEAGHVIEECRNQRPNNNLTVTDLQELSHDEGGSTHDRRHDLAARRCDRLHASREMRAKTAPLHQRNGDRPVDHHIRDRRAGDGAEQTR